MSGSPAPKLHTSIPSFFIFAAWLVTARVIDGARVEMCGVTKSMVED